MVQNFIYFTIGFLSTAIVGVCLLPALWRRAVRLTRKKIELQFPFSMSEIVAERDALRAETAAKLRAMEMNVEILQESLNQERIKSGQQFVDLHELNGQLQNLQQERDRLQLLSEKANNPPIENQKIGTSSTDPDIELEQMGEANQYWFKRYCVLQHSYQDLNLKSQENSQLINQLELRLAVLQSARRQEAAGFKAEISRLQLDMENVRNQLKDVKMQATKLPEDYKKLRSLIRETGNQISLLIGTENKVEK